MLIPLIDSFEWQAVLLALRTFVGWIVMYVVWSVTVLGLYRKAV